MVYIVGSSFTIDLSVNLRLRICTTLLEIVIVFFNKKAPPKGEASLLAEDETGLGFARCARLIRPQIRRTRNSLVLVSVIPNKKAPPEGETSLLAEDETRTRNNLLGRQGL